MYLHKDINVSKASTFAAMQPYSVFSDLCCKLFIAFLILSWFRKETRLGFFAAVWPPSSH